MMENRFCFLTPMYNASKTLARMLHSIAGQSYENWRVFLIDDVSDKFERDAERSIINKFNDIIGEEKIVTVWNHESRGKCWEVDNVLHAMSMCDDNDICARIDGDDFLIDLDALLIIDQAYKHVECDVLWTQHRWGYSDMNISGQLPDGVDPHTYKWVSSHLKTWKKYLSNDVNDVNYRGEDGNYIRRAGDQAVYLPVLAKAKKRFFLQRQMYHYNIPIDKPEIFKSDDTKFQRSEADFIRQRGFVK